ncbi:MAG: hypothetical protein ACRECP_09165 [Methylocella sp.]
MLKSTPTVTLEMGKLIAEARAEVMLPSDILDHYAKHGRNFLKPQIIPEGSDNIVGTRPLVRVVGYQAN